MSKKRQEIHWSTLNAHSARRKAILYFAAFICGLSSNNGVLSNGCAIRYINAFPYYRSTSKGTHYIHRVVGLVVINICHWLDGTWGHRHAIFSRAICFITKSSVASIDTIIAQKRRSRLPGLCIIRTNERMHNGDRVHNVVKQWWNRCEQALH